VLIVSGGQGRQENIAEALAMGRYLTEKGVPAEQIFKEEKSTSTYENFLFSKDILEQKFPQGYSAVFIIVISTIKWNFVTTPPLRGTPP
jgi:uncharacterized SAM-binding protein YcdF (DUF218 family)